MNVVLANVNQMELEAERKDKERQEEEEITEEPKRFTVQEMVRGFSLFEEALLVLGGTGTKPRMVHEGYSSCLECNLMVLGHL